MSAALMLLAPLLTLTIWVARETHGGRQIEAQLRLARALSLFCSGAIGA